MVVDRPSGPRQEIPYFFLDGIGGGRHLDLAQLVANAAPLPPVIKGPDKGTEAMVGVVDHALGDQVLIEIK